MKIINLILIFAVLILNFQNVSGAENEYGLVKAWFNGENATVNGVKLRINEPVELKVEVISKINGNVHLKLREPGVTNAYEVISGPSKEGERVDNMAVSPDWTKTFQWKIRPNGAWKNGNAPINIFVSFYSLKKEDQKSVEFTIANPYILDEQYTGSPTTTTTSPAPKMTESGSPVKTAPFLSLLAAVFVLLLARRWR